MLARLTVALTLVCAALGAVRGAPPASLPDVDLVGTGTLLRGSSALYHVRVAVSHDWDRRELVDSPVEVRLGARPGLELTTEREGELLRVTIPADAPLGPQALTFTAQTLAGPASSTVEVEVSDPTRLLLRVDSGIVAPGGRLAWRGWVLDIHTRRPVAHAPLILTLRDAQGRPRSRERVVTDRFGRVSGFVRVPGSAIGRHELVLSAADYPELLASEAINVRPFEPQAFSVTVTSETDAAMRNATFQVAVHHADGLPMRDARVEVRDPRRRPLADGRTDASGQLRVTSPSPEIVVAVTDPRGETIHTQHRREDPEEVQLEVFTGGAPAVIGEHMLYTVLARQGERPVATTITLELRLGGALVATRELTTDAAGLAETAFLIVPPAQLRETTQLSLSLTPARPGAALDTLREALQGLNFKPCITGGALLLELDVVRARGGQEKWQVKAWHRPFAERPDMVAALTEAQLACLKLDSVLPQANRGSAARAELSHYTRQHLAFEEELGVELTASVREATSVSHRTPAKVAAASPSVSPTLVAPGDEIQITYDAPDPEGLFLLIDDGVVVAMAPLAAQARLPVPVSASGLLVVEALTLPPHTSQEPSPPERPRVLGQVFVRPPLVDVQLEVPARARPGATLPLEVKVSADGQPVAAALAASVLDERLLALSPGVAEAQPLAAWFGHALLQPLPATSAERVAELTRKPTLSPSDNTLLQRLLGAIATPEPSTHAFFAQVERREAERQWFTSHLEALVAQAARRADLELGGPAEYPLDQLVARVAPASERLDPFGRPRIWTRSRQLNAQLGVESFGAAVTHHRVQEAAPRLRRLRVGVEAELGRLIPLPLHLTRDAWGRPLEAQAHEDVVVVWSAGADGELDTGDDLRYRIDKGPDLRWSAVGYGGGGAGTVGHASSGSGARRERPAVLRERFDTNVLWALAGTGADGQHTFEVPLSDSITTWRVDVDALTEDGRVGHARTQIVASLPVSVDLRLPDALVLGDSYEATALVVNASSAPRDLSLTVTAEGLELGAIAPLGRVDVGESRPVTIPLRAITPGRGRVTLELTDLGSGDGVDSMVKSLDVQGIGAEVHRLARARVVDRARLPIAAPADARGLSATVTAYRGAPDLALSSLNALLSMPTGCFEQTTARNWPNLLVMRMAPTGSALAGRARALVEAGYRALKQFEIGTQGFALYPTSRPAAHLTAIGLVQLVDTARVMDIEREFFERTFRALLARQNPAGHFAVQHGWYGSADQGVVTAYATWAISEALELFKREPHRVEPSPATEESSLDPRILITRADLQRLTRARELGLRALGRPATGPYARYVEALRHLAGRPLRPTVEDSVATLYSSGHAAKVELLGLELLARVRAGDQAGELVDELMAARTPRGAWPTTQSTIHALRALAELDTGAPRGALGLRVADRELPSLPLEGEDLPSRELELSGATHLELSAEAPVQVELRLSWREPEAPRQESKGLRVHVAAPGPVRVGQSATLTVGVQNHGEDEVYLPTAVVELPPGFAIDERALKASVHGLLKHVELIGRRVELYFDAIPAGAVAVVPLTLTASAVADVVMRPVTAFAYYQPEISGRSDQLRLVAVR